MCYTKSVIYKCDHKKMERFVHCEARRGTNAHCSPIANAPPEMLDYYCPLHLVRPDEALIYTNPVPRDQNFNDEDGNDRESMAPPPRPSRGSNRNNRTNDNDSAAKSVTGSQSRSSAGSTNRNSGSARSTRGSTRRNHEGSLDRDTSAAASTDHSSQLPSQRSLQR